MKYSGWVTYNGYNFFRTGIETSTSSSATSVTITVKTYIQLASGSHEGFWNFQGRTNAGGGYTGWSSGGDAYLQDTSNHQISSASYTKARTTSDQTVTVYGEAKDTYLGVGPGTVSQGISVSKLASYAVTYNANGGAGAPSAQTKWHGIDLNTLSKTIPTRTNYEFLGWSTSSSATAADPAYTKAKMTAGVIYTTNAALTLYAVWKLAFVAPTISKVTAFRSDSSGASDPASTSHIHVDVAWSVDTAVTSENKGRTVAVAIKSGSTQVASGSVSVSATSGTTSFTLAPTTSGNTFSGSYVVSATITDTNNQTATKNAYISGLFKPFTMTNQGKSAAFFGIADALATNLLKIFGKLWVEGRIASYVEGARGNAGIAFYKKELNVNQWNPALLFQTKSGGNWTVGNYDTDDLKFVYFNATNIANNTNSASANINFKSDGTITAIKTWTKIYEFKSGTSTTISIPSACTELLVCARCTSTVAVDGVTVRRYSGSVFIPKALIDTTMSEWMLGGGSVGSTSSGSGTRYCSIRLSTTKALGVGAYCDGTLYSSTTTFYIYWR